MLHRYQYTPAAAKSQRKACFFRNFPNAAQLRLKSFSHVVHSFLSKNAAARRRAAPRLLPRCPHKKGRPNKGALSGVFAVFRAQPCVLEEDAAASLLAVPASPGMPVGFGWARYSSSVRPLALIFWAWSTPT